MTETATNGANALTTTSGTKIVNPSIALPILEDYSELIEAIQTNIMAGEKMRIERISVPSGGGLAFTIIDDNGKETPAPEINGVILNSQNYRMRWLKDYNDLKEGEQNPFCFSQDEVTGSGCPEMNIPTSKKCAECEFSQPGSDRKGGDGSDCHNRCAVFILRENTAMPSNLDLPRTSLGNYRIYRNRLISGSGKPYYYVVTGCKLEKVEKPGKKYSAVVFNKNCNLLPEEVAAMKVLREHLLPLMVVDYTVMKQVAAKIQESEASDNTANGIPDINSLNFNDPAGATAGGSKPAQLY
jgi:hypothetical protein